MKFSKGCRELLYTKELTTKSPMGEKVASELFDLKRRITHLLVVHYFLSVCGSSEAQQHDCKQAWNLSLLVIESHSDNGHQYHCRGFLASPQATTYGPVELYIKLHSFLIGLISKIFESQTATMIGDTELTPYQHYQIWADTPTGQESGSVIQPSRKYLRRSS